MDIIKQKNEIINLGAQEQNSCCFGDQFNVFYAVNVNTFEAECR